MNGKNIKKILIGIFVTIVLVAAFLSVWPLPCKAGYCYGSPCWSSASCLSGCVCAKPGSESEGVCASAN